MATKHSSPAESSGVAPKVCEWSMCMQKATTAEAFKGQLYELCQRHGRLARAQKKADNNQ